MPCSSTSRACPAATSCDSSPGNSPGTTRYSVSRPRATAKAAGAGRLRPPWSCSSVPCPGNQASSHTS
nr:hypothetical protein [Stackebrandtia nassauensis]